VNLKDHSRSVAGWHRLWPVALPVALSVLVVLMIYSRSVSFDFVSWDDDQNVTQNPWFLKGEWWRFWHEHFVGMFVPLVYTVWYGVFKLATPPDPRLFHGLNVLIHAVNSGLVCWLAYLFIPIDRRSKVSTGIATFGAAVLFSLHPLQVESVAWVTGLRDLLCCLLVLVSAQLSLYPGYRLWREAGAFVVFIMALLCKPSAAVVPVAFAVITLADDHRQWRVTLRKYVPWFVVGLIAVIRTKDIQTEVISFAVPDLPLRSRIIVAMDSYGFYLTKLFWPFDLAVDYGRTPDKLISSSQFLWPILILVSTISVIVATARKLHMRDWALLIFAVLALAPTSGLVRFAYQHVSTVADHYMYLPLVAIALLAASLVSRISVRWQLGIIAILGLIWAGLTTRRLAIWQNDKTLFPSMLESNQDSYGANIGMLAIAMREQRYQDGLIYLREAERLEPTNVVTLLDKWLLYVKLGRFQDVVNDMPGHMLTKEQILANPNSRSTIGGQYVVLAYALMQVGDYKQSFEVACLARFAYEEHPDLASFFPYLGQKIGLELPAEKWCK